MLVVVKVPIRAESVVVIVVYYSSMAMIVVGSGVTIITGVDVDGSRKISGFRVLVAAEGGTFFSAECGSIFVVHLMFLSVDEARVLVKVTASILRTEAGRRKSRLNMMNCFLGFSWIVSELAAKLKVLDTDAQERATRELFIRVADGPRSIVLGYVSIRVLYINVSASSSSTGLHHRFPSHRHA